MYSRDAAPKISQLSHMKGIHSSAITAVELIKPSTAFAPNRIITGATGEVKVWDLAKFEHMHGNAADSSLYTWSDPCTTLNTDGYDY